MYPVFEYKETIQKSQINKIIKLISEVLQKNILEIQNNSILYWIKLNYA